MRLQIHSLDFQFPAEKEPVWSKGIERWYQLDAYAFGLAELYTSISKQLDLPGVMVLASPRASNETDLQFVISGATSPSKFVHTLPSVRGAPLMELMGWSGVIICIQNDPQTWIDGLREALDLMDSTSGNIWILQVAQRGPAIYRASLAEFSLGDSSDKKMILDAQSVLIASKNAIENKGRDFCVQSFSDQDFWNWLDPDESDVVRKDEFQISMDWVLRRT